MAETGIQPHNAKPAAVWSSGGDAYDVISRQIASGIEHCVGRLAPRPGERILDLATGTGWTSRIVARSGAEVTGADFAPSLLEAAKQRASAEGLAIEYRLADAESLPFGDASFDGVISTFGVMFVARPEAAAAELARVCRRGGRVALATWLPDSNVFEMFKVMRAYMPAPPSPPPPSPFAWGKRERLHELLSRHFDLRYEDGVTIYRDPDGEMAWKAFVEGYGPTKALAAGLDETKRAALKRDFVAFHDKFRTDLGISVPRQYLVTLGTRT